MQQRDDFLTAKQPDAHTRCKSWRETREQVINELQTSPCEERDAASASQLPKVDGQLGLQRITGRPRIANHARSVFYQGVHHRILAHIALVGATTLGFSLSASAAPRQRKVLLPKETRIAARPWPARTRRRHYPEPICARRVGSRSQGLQDATQKRESPKKPVPRLNTQADAAISAPTEG